MRRNFKLTTLVLTIVLTMLAVVSLTFSLMGYFSAQQTVKREVARSFDYRNRIAEISLENRLETIRHAVTGLGRELALNQWSFARELVGAETLLRSFNEKSVGTQLDILALAKLDNTLPLKLNSPLSRHADRFLEAFIGTGVTSGRWHLVSVPGEKNTQYALMNAIPIVDPQIGQVIARIVFGIGITGNTLLASELAHTANAPSLELWINQQLVAASLASVEKHDPARYLSGSHESKFNSIEGALIFRTYSENQLQQELRDTYQDNLLLSLLVTLVAALVASIFLRRITTYGFGRLVDYAEEVRNENELIPFEMGKTAEFNTLGRALEEMVESIRDDELYLDALLEEATSLILIWDAEQKVTRINRAAESLLGINRADCVGLNLLDVISRSAWGEKPLQDLLNKVIHGAPIQAFETIFGEGEQAHYFIWDITPIRYHGRNRQQTYLAQGTDITDIRRAEEALRASEEQTRMLFNSVAEGIFGIDNTGRCTMANPACVEMLGYREDKEIIGHNAHDLMHYAHVDGTPYPASECQIFNSFAEGKGSHADNEVFWRRDGTSFPVEYWSFPIRVDGEIVGAVVSFMDITLRRESEIQIRELRNYLRNIIDAMPSVLVGVDREFRVTQWNHEAQRVTGLNPEQALGMLLSDAYPLLETELEGIETAITHQSVEQDRRVFTPSSGDVQHCDITIYPLSSGEGSGAVIRIDDVTDQVRLEELVIQSEKMASVGGLAAGMAHEINNPLAGILQNVQVIRQRLSSNLPKNHRIADAHGVQLEPLNGYLEERGILSAIQAVEESGRRASIIVNNMLSFSRKGSFEKERVDLAALMERTLELVSNDYDLRRKYDFRHIKIVREFQEEVPWVYCEPTKIQQVLLNLLKNGAQAMMSNPPPGFEPCLTLRLWLGEGEVGLEVEDNGPGIDEMTRKRVFEPFFTTKAVGEGTGLGLAICYFLITEDHQGSMSVESAPGQGARFIIHLPLLD